MKKVIILWSHPRSRSTALERAFIEREDCYVIHEPLSMSKYKNIDEDKVLEDLLNLPDSIDNRVLAGVTYKGLSQKYVVIKDFPYHSMRAVKELLKTNYLHVFLLRDPYETILSWQKINPFFEEYELGYMELLETINLAKLNGFQGISIIKSSDMVSNTEEVIRKLCSDIDIPYKEEMCNWKKRKKINSWSTWGRYHLTAISSKGFANKKVEDLMLTHRNKQFLDNVRHVYEALLKEAEVSQKFSSSYHA